MKKILGFLICFSMPITASPVFADNSSERKEFNELISEIGLNAGAGWQFNVTGNVRNRGIASMDIETKKSNWPTGQSAVTVSKYFHKKGIPGSIGLSIGYVSISVISGSNYDEASAQQAWNF